jgi:hypothetical protein
MDSQRRYDLEIPADRTGDFADAPGQLIALDAGGQELARRTVVAVSYWRAREMGDLNVRTARGGSPATWERSR